MPRFTRKPNLPSWQKFVLTSVCYSAFAKQGAHEHPARVPGGDPLFFSVLTAGAARLQPLRLSQLQIKGNCNYAELERNVKFLHHWGVVSEDSVRFADAACPEQCK